MIWATQPDGEVISPKTVSEACPSGNHKSQRTGPVSDRKKFETGPRFDQALGLSKVGY